MDQAVTDPVAAANAEAKAAKAPAKPRYTLHLQSVGIPDVKIQGKYPMPLKGEGFKLRINGVEVDAAQTEFKGQKYNYFTVQGVSFWVLGALDRTLDYTIAFPEGYDFAPAKVDRKAVAAASAASAQKRRDAKKGDADAAEANGETDTPAAAVDPAPVAEPAAPIKGKKAQR
jgi:hypothetical protein